MKTVFGYLCGAATASAWWAAALYDNKANRPSTDVDGGGLWGLAFLLSFIALIYAAYLASVDRDKPEVSDKVIQP